MGKTVNKRKLNSSCDSYLYLHKWLYYTVLCFFPNKIHDLWVLLHVCIYPGYKLKCIFLLSVITVCLDLSIDYTNKYCNENCSCFPRFVNRWRVRADLRHPGRSSSSLKVELWLICSSFSQWIISQWAECYRDIWISPLWCKSPVAVFIKMYITK